MEQVRAGTRMLTTAEPRLHNRHPRMKRSALMMMMMMYPKLVGFKRHQLVMELLTRNQLMKELLTRSQLMKELLTRNQLMMERVEKNQVMKVGVSKNKAMNKVIQTRVTTAAHQRSVMTERMTIRTNTKRKKAPKESLRLRTRFLRRNVKMVTKSLFMSPKPHLGLDLSGYSPLWY
jgi:hypothetical protein